MTEPECSPNVLPRIKGAHRHVPSLPRHTRTDHRERIRRRGRNPDAVALEEPGRVRHNQHPIRRADDLPPDLVRDRPLCESYRLRRFSCHLRYARMRLPSGIDLGKIPTIVVIEPMKMVI